MADAPEGLTTNPRLGDGAEVRAGTLIRVRWGTAPDARRAKLVGVGKDSGQIEVKFMDDDSSVKVEMRDIGKLEDFEDKRATCSPDKLMEDAARCREDGNVLFRQGDAAAAIERYNRAILVMSRLDSSDPTLIISGCGHNLWSGMVTMDPKSPAGLVQFQQLIAGKDYTGAPLKGNPPIAQQVKYEYLLVVRGGSMGDVQPALYLNRARSWLALEAYPRVVQDCTMASAIRRAQAAHSRKGLANFLSAILVAALFSWWIEWSKLATALGVVCLIAVTCMNMLNDRVKDKRLCSALYLRSRARLAQGKTDEAREDARSAEKIATVEQQKEVAQLRRDIEDAVRNERGKAPPPPQWKQKAAEMLGIDAFAARLPEVFVEEELEELTEENVKKDEIL